MILIVDDSQIMRRIIGRTIQEAGYSHHRLTEASGCAEALASIEIDPPDLVLSDWNMPDLTGLELLRTLRSRGDQVPFAFLTSESGDRFRACAMQEGALFLLAKPFTAEELQGALDAHFASLRTAT